MRAMNVQELQALIASHTPPCLSIYLPTQRGGSPENRHRFEALMHKARAGLSGLSASEAKSFMAPIEQLSTPDFWEQQSDGLAIFRSRDQIVSYHLPTQVPELVVAADSFHIRPLLRFLQSNQRYYLLTLSQNRVGFFKGSANGLAPVEVEHLPRSLEDALGSEERERSISLHYGASGGKNPIYGGVGKSDTSRDEDLLRFFRAVDQALWPVLRDEKVPMLLAAPQRELPIYRSISRYAHIAEEGLHGNFADSKLEDMHLKAWPIVQQIVEARMKEVREHYDSLVSRARALAEIRGIARFAVQGRVHQLLLQRDAEVWGKFDKMSGDLEQHSLQQSKGDDDVLDDLAEAVLIRGGEVFSFEKSEMPSASPVAAILRW